MAARRILGAVLAGGASSRFGSDKALAMVAGRTLLAQACAVLAPFVDEVVVVGRDGGIADAPVAGLGPLGGIAGALRYAAGKGFDSVLTIACDMPAVPAALLARLAGEAPVYCRDAPVLGHWPAALADGLIERLARLLPSSRPCAGIQGSARQTNAAGEQPWTPGQAGHDGGGGRSVRGWASEIGAVAIPSPVPLANVNTPADLPTA